MPKRISLCYLIYLLGEGYILSGKVEFHVFLFDTPPICVSSRGCEGVIGWRHAYCERDTCKVNVHLTFTFESMEMVCI